MHVRPASLVINLLIPAVLTVLAGTLASGGLLWWWLFYANLQLLALLAKDKMAAMKKSRRTPESTLLILALLGASPALLLGRFLFRHKTAKQSFVAQMAGVIAAQAAILWYFWPQVKVLVL